MGLKVPLELVGEARPTDPRTWEDSVRAALLPDEVVALLATWGPGWLGGVFHVLDPATPEWGALQEAVLERFGAWPGLAERARRALVVVAPDRRGAALAHALGRYLFLGPRGETLEVGSKLEDVARFLVGNLHLTYDSKLPHRVALKHRKLDRAVVAYIELGCEPVYIAASFPSLDDYLDALREQREEPAIHAALGSEPLILAYMNTVAALCLADDISAATREDEIETVLMLAKRREPALFDVAFPAEIQTDPLGDVARQWAATPRLTVEGPLLRTVDRPRFAIPAPLHEEAWWPASDVEAWLIRSTRAFAAVSPHAVESVRAAVEMLAPGLLHGLIRQVTQLDHDRREVVPVSAGTLEVEAEPKLRADAAMARLRDSIDEAWPVLALALCDPSEAIRTRGCWLLDGYEAEPLPTFWIDAIVSAVPPYPQGADPWTFAARYAACAKPSDALVKCCLPAVRDGNWVAAILLSGRIDHDEVFEAFVGGYSKLALADAWERHPGAHGCVLDEPAGAVVGALRAHTRREQGDAVALPVRREGHIRRRPAPSEPGPNRLPDWPSSAVTSALLRRAEPRAVAAFRQAADDTRLTLHARTAATLALLKLDTPDAEKRWSRIEAAWERYWRI